ncbi:MAG TPA: LuxR C-terminal-related transcriptional regulator [Candidatus Dormibacteraeota bacterium]|nr:LuxR C-terminal-related transcriptional regulator [Candidatus Dormibacteraeota bacterium]
MPGQRSLPAELSSFVGRRQELADVRGLLAHARLVTLTGFGGVGKSRLALRTARLCERVFADGVRLVELAPLSDPALVTMAVARGLGLTDERPGDLEDELADHVAGRRLLLVVDNCEHVLPAAAALVGRLLRASPELRVLTTSREPLGVEGEVVYQLTPLAQPEAVTLFTERAQAALPGFELTAGNQGAVGRLCRTLDGIPLAIEFAAVRLRALSLDEIVEHLEGELELPSPTEHGRPVRQQTLRATMNWSYELLDEPERVLWRRLSAFAGGFELSAAQEVCAGGVVAAGRILAGMVGLVERSVVVRELSESRTRYRLLEPVRQYGRERLRAAGEEQELRRRHRDWCAGLARSEARRWWGPAQRDVLERLEAEHENLRAALTYCQETPGEAPAGLALCADTWYFWHAQRHAGEGRRWLTGLLERAPEPTVERAAALAALGTLLVFQNEAATAGPILVEAEALARQLDQRRTSAQVLGRLAMVAAAQRDLARAAALTGEAVRVAREAGDAETLATALSQAARVSLGRADVQAAVAMYHECVGLCRGAGERWLRQRALLPLAMALSDLGDHDAARRLARESLGIARDLGDDRMMTWSVECLAWSSAAAGRAEEAALLLGAASAVRGEEAASIYGGDRERTERCRAAATAALGDAAFQAAWARGAGLERAAALALAAGGSLERARTARRSIESPLSEREREIAALVAEGLSNRDIAERLSISVRTAENHVSHILVKLGMRSRAQLVRWVSTGAGES